MNVFSIITRITLTKELKELFSFIENLKNLLNRLNHNIGIKRYISSVFFLFGDKFLRLSLILYINVIVARYLKPEAFGKLNFAISFVSLILPISALGLKDIIIKNIVNRNYSTNDLIVSSLILKFFGSILSCCIIFIIMIFTNFDNDTNILVYILCGLFFTEIFQIFNNFYVATVQTKNVAISSFTSLIISLILYFSAIKNECGVYIFGILYVMDKMIYGIFLLLKFIRRNPIHFKLNTYTIHTLLREGIPLLLSSVAVMIYMRIDQIMIKYYLDETNVGFYASATKISELFSVIPVLFTTALFPAILNAKKNSSNLIYEKRIINLFYFLSKIGLFIAIIITFFSSNIINILYGEEYLKASIVLKAHIWGIFFAFFGVGGTKILIIEELHFNIFIRTISGALINIIINLILIPKFGIIGAAIATIISQSFAAFFIDVILKKTRKLFLFKIKGLFSIFPKL